MTWKSLRRQSLSAEQWGMSKCFKCHKIGKEGTAFPLGVLRSWHRVGALVRLGMSKETWLKEPGTKARYTAGHGSVWARNCLHPLTAGVEDEEGRAKGGIEGGSGAVGQWEQSRGRRWHRVMAEGQRLGGAAGWHRHYLGLYCVRTERIQPRREGMLLVQGGLKTAFI